MHSIIHIAVGCRVGKVFFHQNSNHANHIFHMPGGSRFTCRRRDAERGGVFFHSLDKAIGQRVDGFVVFLGPFDNFIVNIGYIAYVPHIETARSKPALYHIEYHHHASVAKMAIVVDCHATDIYFDLAGNEGNKVLLFPGERVMDFEHLADCELDGLLGRIPGIPGQPNKNRSSIAQ